MTKTKTLTKEEESLFQDFGRDVSNKSSFYFYCNALFVAIIPLYLFNRVHVLDLNLTAVTSLVVAIVTCTVTYLLVSGYKNTKFVLKHKIFQQKGNVIAKELSRKLASDKNLTKREKDDKILLKKNEVSEYEAMTYSIFYTNVLYLTTVCFLSSFIVGPLTLNPLLNYTFSMLSAAGLSAAIGK